MQDDGVNLNWHDGHHSHLGLKVLSWFALFYVHCKKDMVAFLFVILLNTTGGFFFHSSSGYKIIQSCVCYKVRNSKTYLSLENIFEYVPAYPQQLR